MSAGNLLLIFSLCLISYMAGSHHYRVIRIDDCTIVYKEEPYFKNSGCVYILGDEDVTDI